MEACILGAADAYEGSHERAPIPAGARPGGGGQLMRGEARRQFRLDVVEALLRAV